MLLVVMAVLAPMAAFAGTSSTSARTDCAKLRAAMGATAFSQAYATFGACVSRYAPIEQQVTSSANVTCTAQQADPDFAATHGGKTFCPVLRRRRDGQERLCEVRSDRGEGE